MSSDSSSISINISASATETGSSDEPSEDTCYETHVADNKERADDDGEEAEDEENVEGDDEADEGDEDTALSLAGNKQQQQAAAAARNGFSIDSLLQLKLNGQLDNKNKQPSDHHQPNAAVNSANLTAAGLDKPFNASSHRQQSTESMGLGLVPGSPLLIAAAHNLVTNAIHMQGNGTLLPHTASLMAARLAFLQQQSAAFNMAVGLQRVAAAQQPCQTTTAQHHKPPTAAVAAEHNAEAMPKSSSPSRQSSSAAATSSVSSPLGSSEAVILGTGAKVTPAKKYKCDVCHKAFSRSNTLITHKRIHTGEKPFKCEHCGRAFRQPGNLTRHRLTHTTVKPYVCAQCGKAFNRASNLHTHMRTHSTARPFVCAVCNKAFQQKLDYKIHMYSHTGECAQSSASSLPVSAFPANLI